MSSISIKGAISQSNGRLKRDGYRVAIVLVRDRLYLQATLPPAPSSRKTQPHQQKLSLKLPANPEALKVAERRARELGQQLQTGEFDWALWRDRPTAQALLAADWIEQFESDYWARRAKNPKSETTWAIDYAGPFRRLSPYEPLTAAAILAAVKATTPDTRTRRRVCLAFKALARFAGLEIDLKPYQGNYGPSQVNDRQIPTDAAILAAWERIESEEWRWVFGVLAAYGLRPHEAFLCRFDSYPRLWVAGDKSRRSARLVFPLHPDWPDRFGLRVRRLPNCSGRRNADLGHRVTQAFRRMGIGFTPYGLRHGYALRAIGKVPESIAAKQMGHSVAVHCQIYQRWLTAADLERFYQNQPKP